MSVNITATNLQAPRVSLVSSSDVLDIAGDYWWGGIELLPLSAKGATGWFPICPTDETKDALRRYGAERFTPFAVYATDDCSSFGSGSTNFHERADQKLESAESYWVERAFWEGLVAGNPSLTGNPSINLGSESPLDAFAKLDAAVHTDLTDGRGMIHLTPELFDHLQQYNLFRRSGNVWLSPLDNLVVPGRGYTGNGPDPDDEDDNEATDTVQWMFGHPGVTRLVRGEIMRLPDNDNLLFQMNRNTNDIFALSERVWAYVIANGLGNDAEGPLQTGFYAIEVDLSLGGGDASGGGGGGDATAANQTAGNAILADIESAVDGLETALTAPTIAVEPVTGDEAIASANWLRGWSIWNTAAGLSEVTIHNGVTSAAPVLVRFRLAENESYTAVLPVRLPAPDGVHYEVVSGTAVGTVYYEV